jgi:hypothetical protein
MHSVFIHTVVLVLSLTFPLPYAFPNDAVIIADFGELVRHLENGGSVAVVVDLEAVGSVEGYEESPGFVSDVIGFSPVGFAMYRYGGGTEGYSYIVLNSAAELVDTRSTPGFETNVVKISEDGSAEIRVRIYYSATDSFSESTATARLATTREDPGGVYVYRR